MDAQVFFKNRETPRKVKKSRALAVACCIYAAAVVLQWLSNRYLADRWWPATWILFAPRWPWLFPFVLLVYASRRIPWRLITLILTGLFVLGPLMGFNIPWRRMTSTYPPKGQPVRLISCNVHRLELDIPRLDALVRESNADVVALQDYSGWDDLKVLHQGWNTRRFREVFFASRFPILRAQSLNLESIRGKDDTDFPRYAGSAACVDVQTDQGVVHVVNLHLASPHTGLISFVAHPGEGKWKLKNNAVRRRNEAIAITQFVSQLKGPVILTGDFNMPGENPLFREFFGNLGNAFESIRWGYGYTHYTPVSQLRLDHVLYNQGIDCANCIIGPRCGTPHRPLIVDLVLHPAR